MGDFNVNWEDRSARKNLKQISDNFDLARKLTSKRFCVSTAKEQESTRIPNKDHAGPFQKHNKQV